jgi:hypothetical protein
VQLLSNLSPPRRNRCSKRQNSINFSHRLRFTLIRSDQHYVGVIAQEVQSIMPNAVFRGPDGYLKVYYNKLGLKFQKYDEWIASGARIPRILSKQE